MTRAKSIHGIPFIMHGRDMIGQGHQAPHAGMNRLMKIEYDMDASGTMGDDQDDYTMAYDYDDNGNMTQRVEYAYDGSTVKVLDYTYDEDDRMTRVEEGATVVAQYRYDPFGRRVLKDTASEDVVFFYDREDVLMEHSWNAFYKAQPGHDWWGPPGPGPGPEVPIGDKAKVARHFNAGGWSHK